MCKITSRLQSWYLQMHSWVWQHDSLDGNQQLSSTYYGSLLAEADQLKPTTILTTDGSTHFQLQLHSWKQFLRGCCVSNLSICTTVNDQRTNCWILCRCGISGKKHGAGKEVVNVEMKQAKWEFQFSESPQPAACPTHCISWSSVVEDHQ